MDYVKELRKYVDHKPLILPGSVFLIINKHDELLLQNKYDGIWRWPGGIMELGESLEETARREVKEETGLEIGDLELVDVFSGKEFYLKVANGDELYSVTAVYVTKEAAGNLVFDQKESIDLKYFKLDELPEDLPKNTRSYIEPYLKKVNNHRLHNN